METQFQSVALSPGDHVYVRRLGMLYTHHGIYAGDGKVIHYTDAGGAAQKQFSRVVETSLDEFLGGGELKLRNHRQISPREKIVKRARRHLDRGGYSLLWNNCEHFATYCATGVKKSRQVRRFVYAATAVMAGMFAGGALRGRGRRA